jgi:hypothetical protein
MNERENAERPGKFLQLISCFERKTEKVFWKEIIEAFRLFRERGAFC